MFVHESRSKSPIIPRQVIFGNPDKTAVKLSPDGKNISYLAPHKGVLNIWVAPRDDLSAAKVVTNDAIRGIRSYTWLYDNQHMVYSLDSNGDENTRLYSVNINTNAIALLTPEIGVKSHLVNISYNFPSEIMIGMNDRDGRYFDIYKHNIATGAKELVLKNTKYDDFVFDDDMQLRFASIINPDGCTDYFKFDNDVAQLYTTVPFEDITEFYGLNKAGDILYMTDSRERNTAALKAIDLKTGQTTILAEDSKADVYPFTVHPTEGTIQAASVNYEKEAYVVLDDTIKADMDYLATLVDGEIKIASRSVDDKVWLIAMLSDNAPVKYYIYDRVAKEAKFIFTNKKSLEQYKLSNMHPVVIKSRDGLDLVSYISFPADAEMDSDLQPSQPLPLVLYVHGGPWSRDEWGFNSAHQWLTNRGYAVLSVNFRSSTGFGKDFLNAGNGQWGRKMHDDLIDAVDWAIANKIAVSDKIAIMGGSYGGYATLAGLTFTPDVFACGVDIVGPSNLITLTKNFPPYWTSQMQAMKKRIGPWETEADKAALLKISPITFVDNIKKPLFIAQGAHDPRVTQVESDQIVAVMNRKNIPVLYALYQDEGHGFARPENRVSFFALTEQFLAKILGGRVEPIGEDLKGANLLLNGEAPKDSKEAEKTVGKAVERK